MYSERHDCLVNIYTTSLQIEFGPDYEDLDLDLDLSVKLFGSDIAWVNYHHKPIDYDRLKGKFNSKLDETADKGKGIDVSFL